MNIDIDCDYYDSPEFHAHLGKHNVQHELIELDGPAGGNANIDLIGSISNIKSLLTEWNFDSSEIDFLLN